MPQHEAHRFIRSISGIIERIPFDEPETEERREIDPVELNNVPQHLRGKFKIILRYVDYEAEGRKPFKAFCLIRSTSPYKAVVVVILINKIYETHFQIFQRQFPNIGYLTTVCERRSLYLSFLWLFIINRVNFRRKSTHARKHLK